jgi:hypothetical protein
MTSFLKVQVPQELVLFGLALGAGSKNSCPGPARGSSAVRRHSDGHASRPAPPHSRQLRLSVSSPDLFRAACRMKV